MRSRWAGKPALAGAQGRVSGPEALQAGPAGPDSNAGKLAVAGAQMRLARQRQAHRRSDRAAS